MEGEFTATRSRTTLKKREKELARAQKQRDKAQKRLMRKNGELNPESSGEGDANGPDDRLHEDSSADGPAVDHTPVPPSQ